MDALLHVLDQKLLLIRITPRCGASTVMASGSCCMSGAFSSENQNKEKGRRGVVKEIHERLLSFYYFHTPYTISPPPSVCLSRSRPSNSFHLASSHPKSSHLDYPYCSECNWVAMGSFHGFLSLFPLLSPFLNLLHVHDTNTETDISPPASLYDIYHCAS